MLEVCGVTVRFGGRSALDDVSLIMEPGRITGIIGPNGAGKSTLFDVITGFQVPTQGKIRLDGDDITSTSPSNRARRGLGRTFQRQELFGTLSVRDNLAVAVRGQRGRRKKDRIEQVCKQLLSRFGLEEIADEPADNLSTGQGRVLELARAAVSEPRILLLDEPASGLDDLETRAFDQVLRDLVSPDVAIALVEHDISLVMSVCDPIYVLDQGKVIAIGSPAEVQANATVRDAYLGDVA